MSIQQIVLFFALLTAFALASGNKGNKGKGSRPYHSEAMKKHFSDKGTFPITISGKEDWPHFDDIMKKGPKSGSYSSYTNKTGQYGGPQLNVDYAGKKK